MQHPSLKFLDGSKSSSDIAGCRDFLGSVKRYLNGVDFCVFDLETGGDFKRGRQYGVPAGDEALVSHCAEILLAGVMPSSIGGYNLIYRDNDERHVLKTLVEHLEVVYNRGGTIVGHNIMGYDIPMVVDRCRLLDVQMPEWLSLAASKNNRGNFEQTRFLDTLYVFNPFSRFPKQSMSLSDTSLFWGRNLPSLGAKFGAMWKAGNEADRDSLMCYNLWNLIDSLSLAVFSGAGDFFGVHGGEFARETSIPRRPWTGSLQYSPKPVPKRGGATVNEWKYPIFTWITAPVPGLFESGLSATRGWGRISTEEAKLAYPHTTGRQNPQATMIVGFIGFDGTANEVFLNAEDEIDAIGKGISWLEERKDSFQIWVDDIEGFRAMTVYRASLYNAITPEWVFFGRKDHMKSIQALETKESGHWTLANVAQSKDVVECGADIVAPPLYCGQDLNRLADHASVWASAAQTFIASCPSNQG